MNKPVFESIKDLLSQNQVEFREVHHEPTYTSEEAAKVRGEELKNGGKALLIKLGDEFKLFVISASCRVDSKSIRNRFGAKKIRFATREELEEKADLVPGSVPPFGTPIIPFPLYVDESIAQNERIAFNAGSLTDSIIMSVEDYLKVAKPEIFKFSKDESI